MLPFLDLGCPPATAHADGEGNRRSRQRVLHHNVSTSVLLQHKNDGRGRLLSSAHKQHRIFGIFSVCDRIAGIPGKAWVDCGIYKFVYPDVLRVYICCMVNQIG